MSGNPVQHALEWEWVEPADVALARHLCDWARQDDDRLCALLALTSAQIRQGNVCLALDGNPQLQALDLVPALEALPASGLLGGDGAIRPLVREGGRLYLTRYHTWERQIIQAIEVRLRSPDLPVDETRLAPMLARLFPEPDGPVDWQRVAAVLALLRPLCVISGGPGTGKTWTVARILALLRAQPGGEALRIGLAAPTGKAAGRLNESIAAADPALAGALPEAQTLHRLLGMRPGRVKACHDAANPLSLDLLIVDEVSMVDMPMLARVLEALPVRARLILLGDRHQLASVQAGRVMADLCGEGSRGFGEARAARIQALSGDPVPRADAPPIAEHLVELRRSRRFDAGRGIGRLAQAVNEGEVRPALAALREESELQWWGNDPTSLERVLRERLLPLVEQVRAMDDPAAAIEAMQSVRILCALRQGPQGMQGLNRWIEAMLGVAGQSWYPGRPVMITVNDYRQRLFNGDVGLVLPDAEGRLRAWFPDPAREGGVRGIAVARLPSHETVFAMTIHKSQGSEFRHVVLVLPDQDNPLLTRELVYTGITRARESVTLCAGESVLRTAIGRRVQRASGLYERLWRTGVASEAPD